MQSEMSDSSENVHTTPQAPDSKNQSSNVPKQAKASASKPSKKRLLLLSVALLIITLAVAAFLFFKSKKSSQQSSGQAEQATLFDFMDIDKDVVTADVSIDPRQVESSYILPPVSGHIKRDKQGIMTSSFAIDKPFVQAKIAELTKQLDSKELDLRPHFNVSENYQLDMQGFMRMLGLTTAFDRTIIKLDLGEIKPDCEAQSKQMSKPALRH